MTQEVPCDRKTAGTSGSRRHELVDLYELLQISPRASQEVIQAAYRVLARSYHPDLNASAQAAHRIRELNAAYKVLSDPQERACYDLECSRAHRFERLPHPDLSGTILRSSAARRDRVLPLSPRAGQLRLADERFTNLHGPAILGLLVGGIVAAILFVFLILGIDARADYNSIFDGPAIEMAQH